MEEVWRNMSLPCLHNPNPTTRSPNMGHFHDFFNMKDPYLDEPSLVMAANHHPYAPVSSFKSTNDHLYRSIKTPTTQMGSVSKKRPSSATNDDDSAGERRRKRLIKNRESADRSRARRLAYTNELEQEMEDLKKENASLRSQLEKVKPRAHLEKVGISSSTAAATSIGDNRQPHSTKGNSLCRTLTAPF